MKITVASIGNPKDKRTWSGTTYQMYNVLKNSKVEVDTIDVSEAISAKVWHKLFNISKRLHLTQAENFETSVFGAKIYGKLFDKAVAKQRKKSDYYLTPAGAGIIAFAKSNVKFIDAPDATYALMNNYYYREIKNKAEELGNKIDRLALEKSSLILVPSDWAKKSVICDYRQSERKVKVVEFGANMPYEDIKPKQLISSKVNVLLVGVEYKRKGVATAIEVVKKLNHIDKQHTYIITIVGLDAPEETKELSSNIIFKGKLNKNNPQELELLQREYRNADLFLLPTKAEAAGIVFSEAAMYGLPIFTYNTGGVGNYCINSENGYALPLKSDSEDFAKLIKIVVNNPTLYKSLSKNGISLYNKKFNWTSWKENVIKNIKEVID